MADLPRQVQAQVDEAEAIDAQLEAARAAATPAVVDPLAPPAQPAQEPLEAPPAPPAAAEPPKPAGEDWEQRYRTLQGMHAADQVTSRAEVARLQGQITAQATALAELTAAQKAATPTKSSVTDKDVEAFGTDLIDLAKRVAGDQLADAEAKWAGERTKLEQEIASLKTTTTTSAERQVQNDRTNFFTAFAAEVPDWQAINKDENFLNWCREIDPLAGHARQLFLDDAFNKFDAPRAAKMFQTWKSLTPAPEPAPAPNADLARQVAPSRSKANDPPPDPAGAKIWTADEVDQFYRAKAKGEFRGRDAEYSAQEAQIDQAMAEGRIK